jgi:hypothetical protein
MGKGVMDFLIAGAPEAALICRQAIVGLQAHGLSAGPMEELQHHVLNRTLPRRGLLAA